MQGPEGGQMPNPQCPMTPDALSRETRPTHWLPNAQISIKTEECFRFTYLHITKS
jgi:hypothetical protein